MRICVIGDATSTHIQRWVSWFASHGHEVHLISDKAVEREDVTLHQIASENGTGTNFVKKIVQTRNIVRTIEPDILNAHYLFGYGVFGAFTGFHPFVASTWGSDILKDMVDSPLKKRLIKYAIKRADVVHVETGMSRKIIKGVVKKRKDILLVPFGVDSRLFSPGKTEGRIRERYGINDEPVVISTRNLRPIYDVETLIRAVPMVVRENPGAKFIVAGSGEFERDLRKLSTRLQVDGSVHFVGNVDHDLLPQYLAESDVYVSTSLSDTISVSLLEAMSCGVVPVVTDIEGNREIIDHGVNGLLFERKNAKALSEGILKYLDDPESRRRTIELNRKTIEEKFEWEKCMARVENKFNGLVG